MESHSIIWEINQNTEIWNQNELLLVRRQITIFGLTIEKINVVLKKNLPLVNYSSDN